MRLQVRHIDKFVERTEAEWPLKRTKWTKLNLDPVELGLGSKRARKNVTLSFAAMGDGLTFLTAPVTEDTEITAPPRSSSLSRPRAATPTCSQCCGCLGLT